MKFKVIAATALFVAASATSVMAAQPGPYVGLNAGIAIMHESDLEDGFGTKANLTFDPGFEVGGVVGYEWATGPRLEAEIAYRKCDTDKLSAPGIPSEKVEGDLGVTSYMINAYYDFSKDSSVSPFVGAGLGIVDGKLSDGFDDISDTTFGYQAMVGVTLKAAPNVNLDLSYRYQGAASDFSMDGVDMSYGSSNILAGVRVKF
ncbi:outer membrane beta-barrel protein [Geomonas oryzisoli]|uniref:Outer membrane beta-barrel protein n=1 Tax=Geomonas oryzisoli TaxID=2847992 RepID=A0ABX8J9A2_9BACT|nr:outer membrane beta-barrel protein [Geomonas oryzisoli]QWV94408.1 outer membrane beta-barrel protein [Geomonas oryzisoli]